MNTINTINALNEATISQSLDESVTPTCEPVWRVVGGSIATGQTFGMTGSRLGGTLANEMRRRQARYGVVTMCIGGGQGAAGLFERPSR